MAEVTGCDLEWLLTGKEQNNVFSGPNKAILQKIDDFLSSNPALCQSLEAFVELLGKKMLLKRIPAKLREN